MNRVTVAICLTGLLIITAGVFWFFSERKIESYSAGNEIIAKVESKRMPSSHPVQEMGISNESKGEKDNAINTEEQLNALFPKTPQEFMKSYCEEVTSSIQQENEKEESLKDCQEIVLNYEADLHDFLSRNWEDMKAHFSEIAEFMSMRFEEEFGSDYIQYGSFKEDLFLSSPILKEVYEKHSEEIDQEIKNPHKNLSFYEVYAGLFWKLDKLAMKGESIDQLDVIDLYNIDQAKNSLSNLQGKDIIRTTILFHYYKNLSKTEGKEAASKKLRELIKDMNKGISR